MPRRGETTRKSGYRPLTLTLYQIQQSAGSLSTHLVATRRPPFVSKLQLDKDGKI